MLFIYTKIAYFLESVNCRDPDPKTEKTEKTEHKSGKFPEIINIKRNQRTFIQISESLRFSGKRQSTEGILQSMLKITEILHTWEILENYSCNL